jgi:hypothetical protein
MARIKQVEITFGNDDVLIVKKFRDLEGLLILNGKPISRRTVKDVKIIE